MKDYVLFYFVYIYILSLSSGSKKFFISPSLMDFVYKNFDIDAVDHCEFLFDENEETRGDIKAQIYHDLLQTLKMYNVTTLVNSNYTYHLNILSERKETLRFPTLYYISITASESTKVTKFLKRQSNIALANDIWLVVIDTKTHSREGSNVQLSKDVENLIPNLELDSQVLIILPTMLNSDNFMLYETYKISNNSEIRVQNLGEFSLNEKLHKPNITDFRPLWERRRNLNGILLKAGWREGAPFLYTVNHTKSSKLEISGVNYNLAKSLSELFNFTMDLKEVDVYGALQLDGTWTGIVERLRTNQLDLGIADISITMEREKVIDFSVGLYNTEYVLFMKSSDQAFQWMTFIDVFSNGFWSCLITFVITLTVFIAIMQIYSLDGAPILQSTIQVLNSSLAIVVRPIGALGIDNDVKKSSYRIIIFSVCFFGTLVYWSYCAVLTSLLTVSDTPLTINKLEDIEGHKRYKLYYQTGTAAFNYFSQANELTNPAAYRIYKEYYSEDPSISRLIDVGNVSKANKAMEGDPNVIFFHTHISGELELRGYPCVLTYAPTTYLHNSLAFSFPKNSPYRKLFSYYLLAMRQSGQIQRLYDMHTTKINTLKHEHEKCIKQPKTFFQACRPNEPNCVPAINLKIVITALVIIIGGAIFSIFVAIIEKIDYKDQFHFCKNIKNNISPKYFLKKQCVLIIIAIILFISAIIVISLLAYYTIGQNDDVMSFFEFQSLNDD